MSDEWKIAQGLKKRNQDLSFGNPDGVVSASYDYLERTKKKRRIEAIVAYWSKGDDLFFKPKKKEDLIKSLKIYLDYCEENNLPKRGIYNDQRFTINDKSPLNVSFFENPNASWGNFARPPKEMVSISDTNTQYNIEISLNRHIFTTIRDQKRRIVEDFTLERSVLVRDDGNIIEFYRFNTTGDKTLDKQIREYLASKNPEFIISEKDEKRTYSEIQRQNVSKDKSVNPGLVVDGMLSDGLQVCVEKNPNIQPSELTYDSFVESAKKRVSDCQQIYSMISELYKEKEQPAPIETEEQSVINKTEAQTETIEVEEQQSTIIQETGTTGQTNVDELSDTELDKFIKEMDVKQKDNQQKIDRLKKIKRAKELIALSKQQDREISELESQIQKEGMEFDG